MPSRGLTTLAAAVIAIVATTAAADVPKPADIAACNREAQEALRAGSASPSSVSPNQQDVSRAAQARRGDAATAGTPSSDPQLEGIDPEGAKDPVYQAAFRTCMRKSGF